MPPADPPTPPDADLWAALPGMALLIDIDGAAHRAHASVAEFAGCSPDALLGTGWHASLSPDSLQRLRQALHGAGPGADATGFRIDLEWRDDGRDTSWVECSGHWMPGHTRCFCLLRDI